MNATVHGAPTITSIGIDVSKDWFDMAAHPAGWPRNKVLKLPVERFDRTQAGAGLLQQWIAGQQAQGVVFRELTMESTGRYSTQLAAWIRKAGCDLPIAIANPRQVRDHGASLGIRTRTDRVDACIIASYGSRMQPEPTPVQASVYRSLILLSRQRQSLVEMGQALKNQLNDCRMADVCSSAAGLVVETLDSTLLHLEEQIEKLDSAIEKLVSEDPLLEGDVKIVKTMPGVGPVVSTGVLAELGDLRHYRSHESLVCFAGLTPKSKDSGKTVRGRGFMSKEGSPHVRRLLYLAAMAAVKGDNCFAADYRQLMARGKSRRSALGAVMRKILRIMRAVIMSGKPYDDKERTEERARHTPKEKNLCSSTNTSKGK